MVISPDVGSCLFGRQITVLRMSLNSGSPEASSPSISWELTQKFAKSGLTLSLTQTLHRPSPEGTAAPIMVWKTSSQNVCWSPHTSSRRLRWVAPRWVRAGPFPQGPDILLRLKGVIQDGLLSSKSPVSVWLGVCLRSPGIFTLRSDPVFTAREVTVFYPDPYGTSPSSCLHTGPSWIPFCGCWTSHGVKRKEAALDFLLESKWLEAKVETLSFAGFQGQPRTDAHADWSCARCLPALSEA